MSKYQDLVHQKINQIFDNPFFRIEVNYRPDWLKNEKTNKNLELDFAIFFKNINGRNIKSKYPIITFEIQGEQHFRNVKIFRSNADEIKHRDILKSDICNKFKIPHIEVFYSEINENMNIISIIMRHLESFGKRQKFKVAEIFRCIRFDPVKQKDVDKWLNWYVKQPKINHTYSKTKLKQKRKKQYIAYKNRIASKNINDKND